MWSTTVYQAEKIGKVLFIRVRIQSRDKRVMARRNKYDSLNTVRRRDNYVHSRSVANGFDLVTKMILFHFVLHLIALTSLLFRIAIS
jgi:hypothetical protein